MPCLPGSVLWVSGGLSAVEVRLVAKVDLDPVTAVQRFDARFAHRLSGVAVPGAGPVGAAPGDDRVDPLLELDVVGGDEPLAPILGDPDTGLVGAAHEHEPAVGQGGRTCLTDHLAADVVA